MNRQELEDKRDALSAELDKVDSSLEVIRTENWEETLDRFEKEYVGKCYQRHPSGGNIHRVMSLERHPGVAKFLTLDLDVDYEEGEFNCYFLELQKENIDRLFEISGEEYDRRIEEFLGLADKVLKREEI